MICPGHTASEAAGHLVPQFLDGHYVVGLDLVTPAEASDIVQAVAQSGQRAEINQNATH